MKSRALFCLKNEREERAGESLLRWRYKCVFLLCCVVLINVPKKKVTLLNCLRVVCLFLFQLKTTQHPSVQFLGNEGVSSFISSFKIDLLER